ncbi:MAG: thermonuclease family protein [Caldilineaceae bacterium]|nr:thermonuclease family protein [Caldilineaceae bacterium]
MRRRHKFVVAGSVFVLLFVLLATQLSAQSPTATPTATTPVATTPTIPATPSIVTALSTRQAVVKRPIDGDSFEIVLVDDGEVVTVHLANVDAPESIGSVQCFGRESLEYVTQILRDNPLISISLVGEIQDGEVFGYVELPGGILLNRLVVLFGYARFDDQIESVFASDIEDAEEQSKLGKAGLWHVCGETEQPPQPCFLFSQGGIDSASKRAFFEEYPDVNELGGYFGNVSYDPAQNELIVIWSISLNDTLSGWRMREFYRLSDCTRDRSEVFNQRDSH